MCANVIGNKLSNQKEKEKHLTETQHLSSFWVRFMSAGAGGVQYIFPYDAEADVLGRKIRECYLESCHVRAALKAGLASRVDTGKFITDFIGSGMGILAKTQDYCRGCQGGDKSLFLQVGLRGVISETFGRSLPGSSLLKQSM